MPEIHLFNAWFKEKIGDVNGAQAAFLQCDHEFESYSTDAIRRKANMERRMVCRCLIFARLSKLSRV